MKFYILIGFLLSISCIVLSGQDIKHNVFMVSLADKENSPYSVFHPEEFLSLRSLERRFIQKIEIDETDLPVNPIYISTIEALGAKVINRSKWLNSLAVYIPDSVILKKIDDLPFVLSMLPLGSKKEPKEVIIGEKNALNEYKKTENFWGATLNQVAMLAGDVLHNLGHKGKGKHVAIFDGGFVNVYRMPVFDSLYANNRILGTRDFVEGDAFVYESSNHGTNVLSCMAANLPYLLMGTAPEASYYLFKTEDVGSEFRIEEFNWVAAAEYADSLGVDVINSSLGYTTFNDPKMNYSYEDLNGRTGICSRGADFAVLKGMLVVNSAGNEGDGNWHYIGTPADAHHVISVGAVRSNGSKAAFSSYGPTPDGRIKPNVSAQGSRVVVANDKGNGLSQTDGTSFSSPIIAGMITTLWSAFPEKSNWEIKDAVEAAGSQTMQPDSALGYGIPDFFKAYLSMMESGMAVSSNGEFFSTQTLVKNSLTVMLECEKETRVKYTLCNKLSQVLYEGEVLTRPMEVNILDLPIINTLPSDVYLIRITIGNYSFTERIVK